MSFFTLDANGCVTATRVGAAAAAISGLITASAATAGFFVTSSNPKLAYVLDPWLLVDAVVLLAMAVLVFYKSRVGAGLLLLYFVSSKAYMWFVAGTPNVFFITAILLGLYVHAFRATLKWHTLSRASASSSTS